MRKKVPAGSIYKRKFKDRTGKQCVASTYTVKYYVAGKPVRESTGTDDRAAALVVLRQRMARADRCREYSNELSRVLVDQLLDLVVEDYRYNKRASTYDAELRINRHLRPFFGHKKAGNIASVELKKYVAERLKKAEAATVNKELAYLRRAFRLGYENEPQLVERVPAIKMLPLENTRTGVVSHEQYRLIRDSLPSYARIALVISYHTGARKGEINKIRIETINFQSRRIELRAKTTKNKSARYLPIYGDMAAELSMAISSGNSSSCPFLVQDAGVPIRDWEKSWKTACRIANVSDALFHDLRRTALTNMIEAGFSEKEAMEISGHKTRSVFDRYHIGSERRLNQLGERMETHMRLKETEILGTDSGHRQNVRTD